MNSKIKFRLDILLVKNLEVFCLILEILNINKASYDLSALFIEVLLRMEFVHSLGLSSDRCREPVASVGSEWSWLSAAIRRLLYNVWLVGHIVF